VLASSLGTYLYGRGMYETMVYWKTAHTIPTNRSSCSTGRSSGGRLRRSFTQESWPIRTVHISTRSGGLKTTLSTTSPLMDLKSLPFAVGRPRLKNPDKKASLKRISM
jgi:hypothetical protein